MGWKYYTERALDGTAGQSHHLADLPVFITFLPTIYQPGACKLALLRRTPWWLLLIRKLICAAIHDARRSCAQYLTAFVSQCLQQWRAIPVLQYCRIV